MSEVFAVWEGDTEAQHSPASNVHTMLVQYCGIHYEQC